MIKSGKALLFFMALAAGFECAGQDFQKTATGVRMVVKGVAVEIQFYDPSTVRVIKCPEGKEVTRKSLSVIAVPEAVPLKIKKSEKSLSVSSGKVTAILGWDGEEVTFYAKERLLGEKEGGTLLQAVDDAGVSAYVAAQSFLLEPDEAIYGLGQQQRGKMIQRNLRLHMVQGNTDDYVPFFQSVKGYGIFWDNYSPTLFEDNKDGTTFRSQVGEGVDYYFMYGGNADGVIAGMRHLTGQAPMMPLWTYGFWQSKERYKSQQELVDVVRKYRELKVPLDGVIQDWQYWGNNYLWNAMDFLNPEFPNPRKMVTDVHGMNAHMIISVWSNFGPHTLPYRELDSIKALFNFKTWPESGSDKWPPNLDYPSGVRVYDAYNPAARDIYWKYAKNLSSIGIDGWWMDSSEPDHFHANDSDYNTRTFLGSFRRVRNAYPLMTVGGVYDHQRSETSAKRVFILTRSAFAGQQRYGANTWSGDVTASWDALRNQISAGLNFSLTGIPYWNSDIGGFFLTKYRRKLEDPEYRELYTRWLEFGTFCPMMRSHGADAPREIWQFGQKGEPVYDAIEKYIRLRYALLPYIYSTSWQVTAHQSSMMRALVMDYPGDKKALNINDEFLFGKSLLVSPVDTPAREKESYLPAGASWFDFWTGRVYAGGERVKKETPLDIIPVYVKAGSILPVAGVVQYSTEKKWDELEIRVYPGANGEFELYEDENDGYNYEKGAFATIGFRWDDKKKVLTIGERKGSFPGMLERRKFNVVIVGGAPDRVVAYEGKEVNVVIK
ncbi:MAG TPA: TIM-barrel domain-containing protein [Puia sp.]